MFDPQNLGRVHGEVAQTQTQQQARQTRVTRHFSAQRDFFTGGRALGNRIGYQIQDGRMQWVLQMRHLLIGPVNSECVLDQIIGTDRQKIKMLEEQWQA